MASAPSASRSLPSVVGPRITVQGIIIIIFARLCVMAATLPSNPISGDVKDLPPEDSQALHDRAHILRLDGKYAEARTLYEQLVAMAEAEHGPEHPI